MNAFRERKPIPYKEQEIQTVKFDIWYAPSQMSSSRARTETGLPRPVQKIRDAFRTQIGQTADQLWQQCSLTVM